MKNIMALLLIILGTTFDFGSDQIPNLMQPRYNVYAAGQPTEAGFEELAALGVKTVINVLPEGEVMPGEPEIVARNRMVYYSLPFSTSGFQFETIEKFATLMENSEKPVLVHCSTGNHVGGLWFSYRILIENAPIAPALKEGRRIGMNAELEDALFDWVLNQQRKRASN